MEASRERGAYSVAKKPRGLDSWISQKEIGLGAKELQ